MADPEAPTANLEDRIVVIMFLGHRISVRSKLIDNPLDFRQLYVLLALGQLANSSPDLLDVCHGAMSASKTQDDAGAGTNSTPAQ